MPRRRSKSDSSDTSPAQSPVSHAGDGGTLLEVQRGGKRYKGQVVVARRWCPDLGASPPRDLAFRIVLLAEPASVKDADIASGRVVVCIPAESVASGRITESVAQYEAGETAAPAFPVAMEHYDQGTVLVGGRFSVEPSELFVQGQVREVLARLAALADLDGIGPQVADVRTYMESAQPPERLDELYLDHLSLVEQLVEEQIWANPGVWPSVRALFELYKAKYVPAYLSHHRRYRTETSDLRRQLDGAQARADALRLLNGIAELGPPVGEAALTASQGLRERLVPCQRPEQDLTGLASDPRCPACRVPLKAAPPTELVRRTLAALDAALEEQQRRLSSEAAHRILDRRDEPRLDRFLDVLRAADIGSLATVMDGELAAFLRELLGEATVDVSWAQLQRELNDQFPEIAEQETGAFAAVLAEILDRAAADARAAHPNKRIRLRIR
ncbi:MAG: hypothetical protein V3V35_06925 [Dehalococcoidia bacterium]